MELKKLLKKAGKKLKKQVKKRLEENKELSDIRRKAKLNELKKKAEEEGKQQAHKLDRFKL